VNGEGRGPAAADVAMPLLEPGVGPVRVKGDEQTVLDVSTRRRCRPPTASSSEPASLLSDGWAGSGGGGAACLLPDAAPGTTSPDNNSSASSLTKLSSRLHGCAAGAGRGGRDDTERVAVKVMDLPAVTYCRWREAWGASDARSCCCGTSACGCPGKAGGRAPTPGCCWCWLSVLLRWLPACAAASTVVLVVDGPKLPVWLGPMLLEAGLIEPDGRSNKSAGGNTTLASSSRSTSAVEEGRSAGSGLRQA
jgi:hypothetical protein